MTSGPLIGMKLAPDSLATAFASKVFPVPGGPYNNTPLGGSTPNLSNNSGCLNGSSIISLIFCMIGLIPPTSSYVTVGIALSSNFIPAGSCGNTSNFVISPILTIPSGSVLTTTNLVSPGNGVKNKSVKSIPKNSSRKFPPPLLLTTGEGTIISPLRTGRM